MKIAITGTHGAGKTTLCYLMAAHYKKLGKNVKVIDEVARDCPFPLNENMTPKTVWWIYHEHSKRELDADEKYDIIICDRTKRDSLIYGRYFNLNPLPNNCFKDYDKVILVEPDLKLEEDITRSGDVIFQEQIKGLFKANALDYPHIEIKSSDIFSEEEKWKQYCL